jgi:hypothetical protein
MCTGSPPPPNPQFSIIAIHNFATSSHTLQRFLRLCFFGSGTDFLHISLISTGSDMREVALKSVPRRKKIDGVRTFVVQEIRLKSYLPGERFSPVPVKHERSVYINPTPPY